MAMGSSLISGYNQGRQGSERSLMPVINTLGQMIKANRGRERGTTAVGRGGWSGGGSASDAAAAERQARRDQEELLKKQEAEAQMAQNEADRQQQERESLIANEEARRQETHEAGMERSAMEDEQKQKAGARDEKTMARQEAYEQAKQGLMTGDAQLVEDALGRMMPEQEGRDADVITYGKTETGEKKITARPRKREVPKFTFHPDGYVGVTFPGQDKPTVFESGEEAFKNVVAPMNPQRWNQKPGTAKDQVSRDKNLMDADYKERKLQADIHGDAHEAAMKQFEADGYYQPALYNEEEYQRAYKDYVQKAGGGQMKGRQRPTPTDGGGKAPAQYKGEDAPEGFPNARRGPRGGWYIQKKGRWYPILEGKESSPAAPPKKARPKPKQAPNRTPLPTAEEQPEVEAAGVSFRGTSSAQGRSVLPKESEFKGEKKGKIYKGKSQPPDHPDAQYDEDEGVWYYFDGDRERWEKVRI